MHSKRSMGLLCASMIMLCSCGMIGGKVTPSVDQLRGEYRDSKDAFKTKYEGKEVTVYGKVRTVDLSGALGIVGFESGTEDSLLSVPSVSCDVDPGDFKAFQEVKAKPGDMARVKGTMKIDSMLNLQHCQLVKYGSSAMEAN